MMDEVKLNIDTTGKGVFYIDKDKNKIAQMMVDVSGNDVSVYHTEVQPEFEGQGLAKKLLNNMVAYARAHHLQVTALCPFVHEQFAHHPEDYEDIWKNKKN